MAIHTYRDRGEVMIEVTDRFTFNSQDDFYKALESFEEWQGKCLIDLSATKYIDSSAMGMLLLARDKFSHVWRDHLMMHNHVF